jgi:hypothetical protein
LRVLAETIIPASDTFNVPSAGDDIIFADIVRSLGRDTDHVVDVLAELDTIAGGCFADLDQRTGTPSPPGFARLVGPRSCT